MKTSRPVSKLHKKSTTALKKNDGNDMSINCDVIVVFRISDQFGAIWKPDFGDIVCKSHIFLNCNLLSYKSGKQN